MIKADGKGHKSSIGFQTASSLTQRRDLREEAKKTAVEQGGLERTFDPTSSIAHAGSCR